MHGVLCAWGRQWKGTTVRTNCDNEAVVVDINSGYSQDSFLMHVLRCIFFFFSATFDFNLTAAHIPGCYNTLADGISRNKHVLRGIKKEHSKQANITKSHLPITPNNLLKLRSVWEEEASNIMLWAACCTCYFRFLRSGEISIPSDREYDPSTHLAIKLWRYVLPHENTSTIIIKIKASKTDRSLHICKPKRI